MKKIKTGFALATLSLVLLSGCGGTSDISSSEEPISSSGDSSVIDTTSSSSDTVSSSSSTYTAVEDYDVVGQTKIKLEDGLFEKIMATKSSEDYDEDFMDFTDDGVERMLTESDYAPNDEDEVFTNYVDGDTTQFTSYNGCYTVKVRYLGVDTPESTSEIEEWGKSASLFNKSKLQSAKHVIVQSAGCAQTGECVPADLDSYNRSLAYVWYTDVENPTQDDFRNLNLELVYEGYSLFSGTLEEMDEDFYYAFVDANDIAKSQKKHMYSGEEDPNYYYGDAVELGLDRLYDENFYTNSDDYGNKYSMYCDEYTKWTFEGVVSKKGGTDFYIQDTIDGETYGLYVFTLRSYAPIKVGNRIKISGILQYYGGAYELCGISYSAFNPKNGDIEYVYDEDGNRITEEVTPIKATPQEIYDGKYQAVLVEVVDESASDQNIYFNVAESTYNGETSSYSYGGSQERDSYNTAHPFYNTDNDMVIYGRYGSDMGTVSSFSTFINNADYLRIKIVDDATVFGDYTSTVSTVAEDGTLTDSTTYNYTDTAVCTYKYFTGGTSRYVPGNADAVTDSSKLVAGNKVYDTTYTRKKVGSLIGIAINYVSTGGNQKYSINVCGSGDISEISEIA